MGSSADNDKSRELTPDMLQRLDLADVQWPEPREVEGPSEEEKSAMQKIIDVHNSPETEAKVKSQVITMTNELLPEWQLIGFTRGDLRFMKTTTDQDEDNFKDLCRPGFKVTCVTMIAGGTITQRPHTDVPETGPNGFVDGERVYMYPTNEFFNLKVYLPDTGGPVGHMLRVDCPISFPANMVHAGAVNEIGNERLQVLVRRIGKKKADAVFLEPMDTSTAAGADDGDGGDDADGADGADGADDADDADGADENSVANDEQQQKRKRRKKQKATIETKQDDPDDEGTDSKAADEDTMDTEDPGRDITCLRLSKVRRNGALEWLYEAYDPSLPGGRSERFFPVERDQVDHIKVTDAHGTQLAVDKAARDWWTKNAKPRKRSDPLPFSEVHLGTGSITKAVCRRSGSDPGLSAVEVERDAQCVTKALALLGETVVLGDDVDFTAVPRMLDEQKVRFVLQKPSKWGYFGKLHNIETNSKAIEMICEHAKSEDRLLLRVHLVQTNTSLHCVAVKGCMIADPSSCSWLPLAPESFTRLGIDKICAGYRLVSKHARPPVAMTD